MFSIIIPVFNYDCTVLVKELIHSCSLTTVEYEIIIGNDCSTEPHIVEGLEKLNELPHCRVVNEPRNIGKAYMLFHLAEQAAYPYLILIDSDARLYRDDFIERYLKAAIGHDVVSGHVVIRKDALRKDNKLRYKYEMAASGERTLEYRQRYPYKNLCTINLLIKRSVFLATPFPKQCYQYGYEDTMLGIDLQRMGIKILHIDNPLIHDNIDTDESFLAKTHKALNVLTGLEPVYQKHIRISRTALALRRYGLLWTIKLWHRIFGHLEERLLKVYPSIFLFNIYKLGYFSLIMK